MFLRRIPNIFHRVVKKISFFSHVLHTLEMPILSLHERIYIYIFIIFFLKRTVNFLFILYSKESYVPFFPWCFSSDCTFSVFFIPAFS